ncbi:chemotaxis protein CheW [Roseateles sp. BYS87W]|uniref:Chemotaxis protein CheW n=1 Tax=Pelomonas baiyunensis TaxID=3299026 RepID=A0ABW7GVN3_9BURK
MPTPHRWPAARSLRGPRALNQGAAAPARLAAASALPRPPAEDEETAAAPPDASPDAQPSAPLATAPAAAAAAQRLDGALGLIRLGPALLAVPIAALREVAACPATLQAVALDTPGLVGALPLRQQQVPVLDLGPRMGQPAQLPSRGKVVVILTWQGQRLGLLVDDVCGMASVKPGQVQPIGPDTHDANDRGGPAPCLAAALVSLADGGCASLLNLPALARLPGLPWVSDSLAALRAATRSTEADGEGGRISLLLFDAEPMPLAIEAMSVFTTVPEAEVRANALTSELCSGVIDHQGRQVPVLDTLQALGLGRQAPATRVSCLLLSDGQGGMVALRLDRVRDITAVPRNSIAPMPEMAVLDAGMFSGVYRCPERGQHLVIEPAGLFAHPWIQGLAKTAQIGSAAPGQRPPAGLGLPGSLASAGRAAPGKPPGSALAASQQDSFLLFSAGQPYACRLKLISEIIRYPGKMVSLEGRGELLGLHMHQGRAVPMLCLSRILGHAAPTDIEQVRVLLVERSGQMLGLAVQSISAIETAAWHHQPTRRAGADEASAVQLGELIEVPTADGQGRHTVQVLDLDSWLEQMTRPGAAADLRQRLAQSTLECGIRTAGCDVI